jgi:zinc protease
MATAARRGLAPLRATLANGTTAIAQHTSTHAAVTVHASVPAGSGHDPETTPGLAYFASKVIDHGTASRSADQLAEAFDGRGVSLSVGVSRHLMTFTCTCLADDVEAVLGLLADVITRPTFPADQVDRRRSVVITSIRQDADNPAVVATESLMAALYPNGHPYGRPSKGSVASAQATTRDALAGFHHAHAGPAGLRVVIVGDVAPARAVALADAAFGGWQAVSGAPLNPPPATPALARTLRFIDMPGKMQSDIAYGFTAIVRADPRYYALTLMNTVLGQYGLGGRLGDSIRERQGMAYYVFSAFDANVAEGPLLVRAGVNPANVPRALASIDEELSRMARDGVTGAELSDAKRYLIGSLPRTLETNGGIAAFLHTADFFGLGVDFDQRLPGLLDAVTREDVHDVARTFLAPERATIVVAGPPMDAASGSAGPGA